MASEEKIQGRAQESADNVPGEGGGARADGGESGGGKGRRYSHLSERNRCRFTRAGVKRIDYKDVVSLHKLMTTQGKILSRKRTGIAARYQRMVKKVIKRARFMALLPYTGIKG